MQGWRATALCVTFHDSRKPGKLPASVSRTASPRRGSGRGEMTGFSSHKRCHTLVRVQKSSVSAGGASGCWGMKRTLSALPRPRLPAARWLFWCHTRGNVHDGLKRRFRPSPLPSRVFPHLDHDTRQRTARRGTQENPAASSPARRFPRQVPGSNARQCALSPDARTLGVKLLPAVPALRAGTRVRGLGCPQYSADRGHQVRFVNAVRTQGPLTLNE